MVKRKYHQTGGILNDFPIVSVLEKGSNASTSPLHSGLANLSAFKFIAAESTLYHLQSLILIPLSPTSLVTPRLVSAAPSESCTLRRPPSTHNVHLASSVRTLGPDTGLTVEQTLYGALALAYWSLAACLPHHITLPNTSNLAPSSHFHNMVMRCTLPYPTQGQAAAFHFVAATVSSQIPNAQTVHVPEYSSHLRLADDRLTKSQCRIPNTHTDSSQHGLVPILYPGCVTPDL